VCVYDAEREIDRERETEMVFRSKATATQR
jgi:hypothetical protein